MSEHDPSCRCYIDGEEIRQRIMACPVHNPDNATNYFQRRWELAQDKIATLQRELEQERKRYIKLDSDVFHLVRLLCRAKRKPGSEDSDLAIYEMWSFAVAQGIAGSVLRTKDAAIAQAEGGKDESK